MTDLRTAAQQALEALEGKRFTACGWRADCDKAITALRAALAEPVPDSKHATISEWSADKQRKPLTEEEIKQLLFESAGMTVTFSAVDLSLARAIERAHGIVEHQ